MDHRHHRQHPGRLLHARHDFTALAISASNATNPRIETIIAQVKDAAYAGTEVTFSVSVVVGTAEAGRRYANLKGAGAVPASSLVLAYVLVPAKAVSIEAADIENRATAVGIGLSPLPMTLHSSSGTMKSGEAWEMVSTATVTLGPAFLGSEYELLSNGSATTTVKAGPGANIYGDFINSAATITLLPLQHVRLRGDGTNYIIVAGEPKRESKYVEKNYTKAEAEAGIEFNASRSALVFLSASDNLRIGGEPIGGAGGEAITIEVPPGQKITLTTSVTADSILR